MNPLKGYVGERVTFRDLFEHHSHVEIPIIQRDYAQGRESAFEVRTLFLDAMYSALSKDPGDATLPLDLDFVYGSIEGNNQPAFCPLDGQQRLTTLFLLHWYLAWVDAKTEDFASFTNTSGRSRFAYAVRASSGEFFDSLVKWFPDARPVEVASLLQLIEDQPWFFQWWKRDPTIQSALTMLDAIHERFRVTTGLYDRIIRSRTPYITFQLLDLDNFGLSDDLYIKMNARGKPLTDFETFKALVEKHIGKHFPEPDARELFKRPTTLKNYFSHRIDTTWAEFFWRYRDKRTNLFDVQIMNLIRVVGIITRNPDADGVDDVLETLRGPWATLSFQKYIDNTCLDQSHIELFITLLDALSGPTGQIHTYLTDSNYFDEESVFRRIIGDGGRSTYVQLIQFSAYAHYFRVHDTAIDSEQFGEWMRVIRNLTINSNIERLAQFKGALRSVSELLDNSDRILAFLREDECKFAVFSGQQIREERIKACLILKSNRWKNAVFNAEQHGYFNGQIEFLLDFSGVLDAWNSKLSCDWSDNDDNDYFDKFSGYLEKACMLFNNDGLIPLGDFLTERALLAIGDYMFDKGLNKSFLEDTDDPISWKRLLRGEQTHHAGYRRGYIKQLLDKIDVGTGVRKSLNNLINTTTIPERWRRVIIQNPKVIEFCRRRQIRCCSDSNIYLLRGVRRSGEQVELFSYDLYLGLLAEKYARGELTPFGSPHYRSVHTDSVEPGITLSCDNGKGQLVMEIWNTGTKYRIVLYGRPEEMPPDLKQDFEGQPEFKVDKDGDPCIDVEMTSIEKNIDKVIEIVRRHVSV